MIWIIVISFIIVFLGFILSVSSQPKINLKTSNSADNHKLIRSAIKNYDLVGTFYRPNANKLTGPFFGIAVIAPSIHDRFCVEIRNNKNQLLGYVPKSNHRLFKTIEKLKLGEANAFGEIYYNEYSNFYSGYVNILLNIEKSEEIAIMEFLRLKIENDNFFNSENPTTEDHFKSFDNFLKMDFLFSNIKNKSELYFHYPPSLLPRFSKKLETSKDWENIARLENYNLLIEQLTEMFRNSILKRIEKAKLNINK